MHCFKINGLNITALSKAKAEAIARIAGAPSPRRLIIIPNDGSEPRIVDLEIEAGFDICVQSGSNIDHIGGLIGGTGHKILQAAIESMDTTKSFSSKVSMGKRVVQREKKHQDAADIIKEFESTIPFSVRPLYFEVMDKLDCSTAAYKLTMIEQLDEGGVKFKPQNWQPILSWFKDKVIANDTNLPLEHKRTFYQLRSAFVTTCIRMVEGDVRNTNSMRLVQEAGKDIDWAKYAEENQKGS